MFIIIHELKVFMVFFYVAGSIYVYILNLTYQFRVMDDCYRVCNLDTSKG